MQPVQIMDGGDAYSVPPKWVPFRRFIGYWGSVALGRWLGGLLGYKPFFKEYTTDWDYAVAKMKGSWFQRHLVEESYSKAKSWDEQVALDQGKPFNAEFEQWTVDLSEQAANGVSTAVNGGHVNSNGHANGLKARVPKPQPTD